MRAREKWVEQLTSIGTLIASQGVDITTQVAGVVTEVSIESGQDVEQGAKLVQLDIAVETADLASNKATLAEAEVAYQRQTDLIAKRITSEANLDTARAKRDTAAAAVKRIEAVIAQKAHQGAVRGPARHPQGGEGPVRLAGHGARVAAGARSDPRRLSRCPSRASASCGRPDRSR